MVLQMVLYFGAIVNGLIIMCMALQNIHFGGLAQAGGQKGENIALIKIS